MQSVRFFVLSKMSQIHPGTPWGLNETSGCLQVAVASLPWHERDVPYLQRLPRGTTYLGMANVVLSWMVGRAAEAAAPGVLSMPGCCAPAKYAPPLPVCTASPASGSLRAACSCCFEARGRLARAALKGAAAAAGKQGEQHKLSAQKEGAGVGTASARVDEGQLEDTRYAHGNIICRAFFLQPPLQQCWQCSRAHQAQLTQQGITSGCLPALGDSISKR